MHRLAPIALILALFTPLAACGGGGGGGGADAAGVGAPRLLGRIEIDSSGGSAVISSVIKLRLRVEQSPGAGTLAYDLMPTTLIDQTSVGDLITVDPNSPEYDQAMALLTNGVRDDFLYSTSASGGMSGTSEWGFFKTFLPDGTPDLADWEITEFVIDVHFIDIESPGRNLSGTGIWTDWTFRGDLLVFGRERP